MKSALVPTSTPQSDDPWDSEGLDDFFNAIPDPSATPQEKKATLEKAF